MTLFKRVFDSHFNEEDARAENGTLPEAEAVAPPSSGQSEERAEALSVLSRLDSFEEADAEAPAAEPTLAERAAQIHAQMSLPPAQTRGAEEQQPVPPVSVPHAVAPQPEPVPMAHPVAQHVSDAPAEAGPPARSRGRVKTRLLGFHQGAGGNTDPFQKPQAETAAPSGMFPTGWIVVTDGPGTGNALPIYTGVSTLGRGEDQAIKLDFGDTSISRQNHAAIAYDVEQNKFFLGHGGKSNIIRLNDKPVLSTEDLNHGDILRIGETTLRFVALCGAEFKWAEPDHDAA
ncbi:MAG: FHA domain-containing protein [Pseudomonadota bacterium]